jgi:hypothetical protein
MNILRQNIPAKYTIQLYNLTKLFVCPGMIKPDMIISKMFNR